LVGVVLRNEIGRDAVMWSRCLPGILISLKIREAIDTRGCSTPQQLDDSDVLSSRHVAYVGQIMHFAQECVN